MSSPPFTRPAHPSAVLPQWLPPWAATLSELYFSGTTSTLILHGNANDLVRGGDGDQARYGVLSEFLSEQLFGRWDLVLSYDLARGLRPLAGRDGERLREMVVLANRKVGDLAALRKDPAAVLPQLDRFVNANLMAAENERLSVALILEQASYIVPSGE